MNLPGIDFSRGWAWWLLLLIPVVLIAGRRLARHTPRWRMQVWFRALTLLLLITTLAGPLLVSGQHETTTIFVVDRSASIQPGSSDAANAWVNQALDAAGSDDAASVITFGSSPKLAMPVTAADAASDDWMSDEVDGETTDLGSALSLARALPVGDSRNIVVLSDGGENVGDALAEADQAAADGVSISTVQLPGVDPADLRVDELEGPTALWQGDALPLVVTLGSLGGGSATLDVLVDGESVLSQSVALSQGQSVFSLTAPVLPAGFHAVEVRVTGASGNDRIPENNVAWLGVQVREQPSVLLVASVGSDPARLEQALTSQGADVTIVAPDDVPTKTSGLAGYDAVILDNIPAFDLSDAQQSTIVAHTKDGNGLIVIGGSASFGPGAYAGTTLEEAMPVTVKVVDGAKRPTVAILIVMDRSGSMSYSTRESSTTKLDLAKQGVVTAMSALAPGDQIGVIGFNDEPTWALQMMPVTGSGDVGKVEKALAPLNAEGGTEIYPALQVAYDSMRNVQADVRHIILLSDGKSTSGTRETYSHLVEDIGNDAISLSTVALGNDADLELLEFLATEGHGRYHFANAPEEVPQITFQEARDAGSQSVLRGTFSPVQVQPSPILNGIDTSAMPGVGGYNFSEGRSDAQVDLVSDRGDPLLAKWQLGLGRVVAWTADDGSDYASGWGTWAQYDQFWGQALRWSLPDPTNQSATATIERDGADAVITIDTQVGDGDARDLTGLFLTVTGPDGVAREEPLVSVAPGEFEARLTEPEPGAYALTLDDGATAMTGALQVSPEWLPASDGQALLEDLATRTGGEVLSLDTPPTEALWQMSGGAGTPGTVRPVWHIPLIAALALFVIEIAIRHYGPGTYAGIRGQPRKSA